MELWARDTESVGLQPRPALDEQRKPAPAGPISVHLSAGDGRFLQVDRQKHRPYAEIMQLAPNILALLLNAAKTATWGKAGIGHMPPA